MAFLDAAVVERIVRAVPDRVFLLFKREYSSFGVPFDNILGVYFSYPDATLKALRELMKTPGFTEMYHPHYRFFRRNATFSIQWDDRYRKSHAPMYVIQEWSPHQSTSQCVNTTQLDVLDWLRRKIVDERPSCSKVESWTQNWQEALQAGRIPQELSDRWETESYCRYNTPGAYEEWVAMYGSREYPWGAAILPKPEFA